MEHFGAKLVNKGKSFKLTREEFAVINTKPSLPYFASLAEKNAYADASGKAYNVSWCNEYRQLCLKNYDLNIRYFNLLDKDDFDKTLSRYLSKHKYFVEVTNLNEFADTEGYYIMVLDEYKQVYIGKSTDIKKRILLHWSKTRSFDRTLYPMYAWNRSVFSIDFFRALDTTRIYAWKQRICDGIEAKLISDFPGQFCTNRIGGDINTSIEALITMKQRTLL